MHFFYFLCHLKTTDVIEIKTGKNSKPQIESARVTATLNYTIFKRNRANPSAIRMTYTAPRLGKQGLPFLYLGDSVSSWFHSRLPIHWSPC